MRSSALAREAEFDALSTEPLGSVAGQSGVADGQFFVGSPTVSRSSSLGSQDRDLYQAEMTRLAGRVNAAAAPESEVRDLLRERQALLDKLFAGSITPRERARLALVRWSLERIESARDGGRLHMLEGAIAAYESFADDLRTLRSEMAEQVRRTLDEQRR
jgi:hypothetical protein